MSTNTTNNNIEFYRGDDISFNQEFTDENDSPLDITGWTIFFTVKKNESDSDSKAVLSKEFSDFSAPLTGIASIYVSSSETDSLEGTYYYDFQVKRDDGVILTISKGNITFLRDITRRTT